MELVAQLQEPDPRRLEMNSLVLVQILYHMPVNERIKLRQVCRSWRHIVDNFKTDLLVVIFRSPCNQQYFNLHDLFPFYTCQLNKPNSTNETTCNYPIQSRRSKLWETLNFKKWTYVYENFAKFKYVTSDNRFKSIVSHFLNPRVCVIDISSNPFVENLEFYNYGRAGKYNSFFEWEFREENCSDFARLPRLRRLVLFRCIFRSVFRSCPELQVLKLHECMQLSFFNEIEWLHHNGQVSQLKKLRFWFDYGTNDSKKYLTFSMKENNFFKKFVSLNVLLALPELKKLTLVFGYKTLRKLANHFPFFCIPRISIRLTIRDNEWDDNALHSMRQMISIFQEQLSRHSFEVKVNGYPVTIRTNMVDIERYLTNFLCGARVHPDTQLDAESADRFRSNIYFKRAELPNEKNCPFFRNRFLTWPFLTSLELSVPMSQHFLNRLPKDIPLLRKFWLYKGDGSIENFSEEFEYEYDISFVLEFQQLFCLVLNSFNMTDETVILKVVQMPTLNILFFGFKMQQNVFDELDPLIRTVKKWNILRYKIKCGDNIHHYHDIKLRSLIHT